MDLTIMCTSVEYIGFHAEIASISPAHGPAIHAPSMESVVPGSIVKKNCW